MSTIRTRITKNGVIQERIEGDSIEVYDDSGLTFETGANGGSIAWSPYGNGSAVTWKDVKTLLANSKAPLEISFVDVDPTNGVEYVVDEVTDLHNSIFQAPVGGANQIVLRILDGAQLRNGGIKELVDGLFNGGMTVQFERTSGPASLAWDSATGSSHFSAFGWGAGCSLVNTGSLPAIDVPDASPDSLFALLPANTAHILSGTAPIVSLGTGSFMFIATHNNGLAETNSSWLRADATNLVGVLSTNFNFGQIATWTSASAATYINNPYDLGGGGGPTSLRPFGGIGPLGHGTQYFDTDLTPPRPIYWDGTQFVDATGTGPV